MKVSALFLDYLIVNILKFRRSIWLFSLTLVLFLLADGVLAEKHIRDKLPKELSKIDKERVIEPKSMVMPVYPELGLKKLKNADVWFQLKFNDSGSVEIVEVIYCDNPGYGFEEEATEAIKKSDFPNQSDLANNNSDWWYTKVAFIFKNSDWYPNKLNEKSSEDTLISLPEIVKRGVPEYPKPALKNRITGEVHVLVLVSEDGKPKDVDIKKTIDPYWRLWLNQAAINGAYKCRFTPALREDKPQKVWVSFPYEFTLD